MSVLSTYAPKVEHNAVSDHRKYLEYAKTYELERWILRYWNILVALAECPYNLTRLVKKTKLCRNVVGRVIRRFEKAGIVHTRSEIIEGIGRITLIELDKSFIDSVLKGEEFIKISDRKAYYKLKGYLKRRARERCKRVGYGSLFSSIHPFVTGMEVKEFLSRKRLTLRSSSK